MPLSQVQIIRSLGEALAWFEKELAWGVDPAELRHLTGRIGELYAAMITRGQMALATNQRGYDVVSAEGERVSVKTLTTSTHVTFRKSTFSEVHRVIVLRINIDEGDASIEEIFDGSATEMLDKCRLAGSTYQFQIRRPSLPMQIVDGLKIVAEAKGQWSRFVQFENGAIAVEHEGTFVNVVKPHLRKMAAEFGLSLLTASGRVKNTRQLGAEVIAALNAEEPEQDPEL